MARDAAHAVNKEDAGNARKPSDILPGHELPMKA